MRKSYTSIFEWDFLNSFIASGNKILLNIFSTIFLLHLNENWRCFVNNSTFFLIKCVSFNFFKLKNDGRSDVNATIIKKINNVINLSNLFLLNREKMTEISILNTIILEKVEIFISIIIILLTLIDELFIKSSLKETFVWKFSINFKSFIIKSVARKSFEINIKKSIKTLLKARL